MGIYGFPPKPTRIMQLEGNRGKRPLNLNEPAYTPGVPDQPENLSEEAQKIWDGLVGEMAISGVLRLVDALALAHLCEDQATLDALRLGLRAQAQEVEQKAVEKKKPLIGGGLAAISRTNEGRRTLSSIRELSAQLICQRREFGLTPSSSSRVTATGAGGIANDPLERALCG